ncbi:two component transcriptional regulator, LuxR family [Rhizobium mongolense subsp. loessense]|uniref:Two component transcriptional regulator, LuxR family n=1 Tax=Rhizobium mongolense subsp. loessense TaxID=158890 RepID=A0A1G4TFK9_9HYPH|nr:response regulator transcription factor [Rhizobium mongolense]SCW79399.1 two component transcriptional regulator, LuxR family [Rhizobium mongolense subsp. loessense]
MSGRKSIKVLLIDNHPLVLDGLGAVLETYEHLEIVGTAGLARAGLEIALRERPAVVLMDINMPQLSGIDAIELFKEQLPETRILMLSMHDSREYISTSVLHGASGYILKDVSTDEIIAAIEAVANGKTYFSSGVSDVLLERKETPDALPLTTREHDVLLLLAAGKSNRDIAQTLGISAATVETHRKNIKRKLNITTTAGLTRYAIENGLTWGDS